MHSMQELICMSDTDFAKAFEENLNEYAELTRAGLRTIVQHEKNKTTK